MCGFQVGSVHFNVQRKRKINFEGQRGERNGDNNQRTGAVKPTITVFSAEGHREGAWWPAITARAQGPQGSLCAGLWFQHPTQMSPNALNPHSHLGREA